MPIWSKERDPDWSELATVLRTGDPAMLSVAKSILAGAGISSLAKGEGVQDLFGLGRVGTGYSIITGPVELQVMRGDEEEARSLLLDLVPRKESAPAPAEDNDGGTVTSGVLARVRSAWWRRLIWLVPAVLIALLIVVAVVRWKR
jgi:hypothetical protein